jgi:hypothetical protein
MSTKEDSVMLLLAWLLVSVGVGVIFGAAIDRERLAVRIAFGVGSACILAGGGVLVAALWSWLVTQL